MITWKLFLTGFFFSTVCIVSAQKIKSVSVNAGIVHYPIIGLPDHYKTYSISVNNRGLNLDDFAKIVNPEERINFFNFDRVKGKGDLNISVIIGKLTIYGGGKKFNSIEELKGYPESSLVSYVVTLEYEVTDSRGVIIQREKLGMDNKVYTYDTPPATPKSVAPSWIISNITDHVNNQIEVIAKRLADLFDLYYESYPTSLYSIKAPKTTSYDEFTHTIERLEQSFKTPQKVNGEIQAALNNAINFWESKAASVDQSTELGKDQYFLCMYNLAVAYAMYDDFPKAMEYVDKTMATKIKPGYAAMMKIEVTQKKKHKDEYIVEKQKADKNPTHIYQKGESEQSVTTIWDLVKKSETTPENFMEDGFLVLTSGDSLFGKFIEFDRNLNAGKMLFVQNGSDQKTYTKPFSNIQNASLRGLVYYTDGKGGVLKLEYSSPKIVVLSTSTQAVFIFPEKDKSVSYFFFDPGDGASFVTNYKKKFSEVFSSVCSYVADNALAGKYALKEPGVEPLLPAIRDFETTCGSKQFEIHHASWKPEAIRKRYR